MRRTVVHSRFRIFCSHQSINKSGSKRITASNAVQNLKSLIVLWLMDFSFEPADGSPIIPSKSSYQFYCFLCQPVFLENSLFLTNSPLTIQLPPQQATLSQFKYSLKFFSFTPPVGINLIWNHAFFQRIAIAQYVDGIDSKKVPELHLETFCFCFNYTFYTALFLTLAVIYF